ncbi:hypothetical protein [Paenibacillus sp. O199]|uniref:hypothetical protein n=1 Tax=Paenibacillus sp. O199 TaxID=1643925 RepID=UPI0007BEE827|nr:hypothetical protein [Paenibacillus sp. O199]
MIELGITKAILLPTPDQMTAIDAYNWINPFSALVEEGNISVFFNYAKNNGDENRQYDIFLLETGMAPSNKNFLPISTIEINNKQFHACFTERALGPVDTDEQGIEKLLLEPTPNVATAIRDLTSFHPFSALIEHDGKIALYYRYMKRANNEDTYVYYVYLRETGTFPVDNLSLPITTVMISGRPLHLMYEGRRPTDPPPI